MTLFDPDLDRDQLREQNESRPRLLVGEAMERDVTLAARLADAVDVKGGYFPSHCRGVALIARSIAEEMDLFSRKRIHRITMAAMLHDVGKLLIPDRILLKAGKLTVSEWEVMKTHTIFGEDLLLAAGYGEESLWLRHHHSRWDGTGYPDGTAGEATPIEARIIGVADAFHAIQSDRTYQIGQPRERAMAEITRNAGTQFDPRVVKALLSMPIEAHNGIGT